MPSAIYALSLIAPRLITLMTREQKWIPLGVILIVFSLVLGTGRLLRIPVNSPTDLAPIIGTIASYSLVDGYRGYHSYQIRLDDYAATFQIPADFVGEFYKADFQARCRQGDQIAVLIPRVKLNSVANLPGSVYVFGLYTRDRSFLNEQSTLAIYNSPINWVIFAVSFVAGAAILVWRARLARVRSP